MNELKTVLYTAEVSTTGGRDGASKSNDGHLDVTLSTPKGLGGAGGEGWTAGGHHLPHLGLRRAAGVLRAAPPLHHGGRLLSVLQHA